MGKHRLAGDIADRVNSAHRGAALVVDLDMAPIHVEHQFLAAPALS
jgi:hypothetical protein